MSILVETLTNGNSHSFQDNSGDSHHYNDNAPTGQAVEEKLAATGSGERTQKTLDQRLHEAVDVISKLYPEIQIVPVSGKSPKCGDNWQQKKLSYDLIHDLISGKVKITSDYKDGKKVPGSEKLVKLTYFQRQAQYRCWFGDYRTNRVTGIGIRTGEVSEGLLTVDGDGFEALKLIEAHGGFPLTPSWTSGKPGRRSYLFRVPQEHWAFIQNTKGVKVGDSGDAIEFLWNGSQCVVPPSLYPNGYPTTSQWKKNKETGNLEWVTQENPGYIEGLDFYRWIDDIKTTPIAEAPQWVIEMMKKSSAEERSKLSTEKKSTNRSTTKVYGFASTPHDDAWTVYKARLAWEVVRERRTPGGQQYIELRDKTWSLVAAVGKAEAYRLCSPDWDDQGVLQALIDIYKPGHFTAGTLFDFAVKKLWEHPQHTQEHHEAAGIPWLSPEEYFKKYPERSKRSKRGNSVVDIIKRIDAQKDQKATAANPTAAPNPLQTQVQETRKSIWQKQVFSFDADQVFDDKFLDFEKIKAAIVANPDCWSLNTKSPLGSGKTEILNALLDWLESTGKIQGCFFPTYRNTLALNLCTRIKHLYHLNFHDGMSMTNDTHGRLTCCIDSILKLPPGYFKGRVIVIDEINSILHHLTTSTTLNGKRRAVMARFHEMIRDAAFIITLDGNLTNRDAAYIKTLRGVTDNSGVVNLLNKTQPKDTPVTLIASFKQAPLVAKLDELLPIAIAEGKTITVVSDSQKLLEKLHEKYSKVLPANEIIRIDAKTTGDKNSGAREYMEKPTRLPILLLLSPSAETGLNINEKDFTAPQTCGYVFGFFYGTISPGSVLQLCRRVRHAEKMFIQCNPYVMVQGERYATAKEFKENQAIAIKLDVLDYSDYAKELINKDSTDPTYNLLADHMAEKSYSQVNTFECLVEMFQHHGYSPELVADIELDDPESEDKAKSDLKDIARIIAVREAKGILDAADISHETAKHYKEAFDLSPEKRLQLERYIIKERLPGIELDPVWWVFEGIITIRKEWRKLEPLTINVHSKNLDKARVITSQKWGKWKENDRFLGDCGRAVYAKAAFIASLNIDKLPEIVSKESPELKEFFKAAKTEKQKFKALLGVDLTKLDIEKGDLIILFRKIVQLIGLKLESVGRKNKQSRSYKITPPEGVISMFLEKIGQTVESHAAAALQQSTSPPNCIPEILLVDCKREKKQEQELESAEAVLPASPEPTETVALDNLKKGARIIYFGRECRYVGLWLGNKRVEFLDSGIEFDIAESKWKDITLPTPQLTPA